ncbi:aminotransferase class IV [Candidatus Kaiserbacteria bacterium]|nr:aminotransferase class IV [Candidatus Kaiserbacteria bacterium]
MRYCYLNGRILPEDEAKVSVLDIGLLRGYGIYEAMALVNSTIFRWEDHIARFKKSADFLRITIPHTDKEIRDIIFDLVEKNISDRMPDGGEMPRLNVKCIITGGQALGGIDFDPETPTFYIFLEEWKPLEPTYYTDGARVIVHEHLRQYPEYKTTNYITTALLQKPMKEAGTLEILYTWNGNVLECATSNFFMVKDGTLVTAADNILKGVTRNVVIELARAAGLTVDERAYTLDELLRADEAFLTSSFKDVVPVVQVGDNTIADGLVGATTKKVIGMFADYLRTGAH